VASPDGFGFESPRIVVEVKHRTGSAMGSQEVRSFLGGRNKDDKPLCQHGWLLEGRSLRG
jgi:restriction system protein